MNEYLFEGRVQDHNWALVVEVITKRHHFRLWKTGLKGDGGLPYWRGSANYDKDARYWDLSHIPDPAIDQERDFIQDSLRESGAKTRLIDLPKMPKEGANDKGYAFHTDGRVLFADLSGV